MRKLFAIITFLLLSPLVVNAEECTPEQINGYTSFANQAVVTPKRLGDSDTYEIWASNVKGGIALENGRTVFDSGFLGYATSGESYNVRIYVADGSACAGQTIKNLKINIPANVTPPKEEPTPPTNNNDGNSSNNTENQKPPVVNQKPNDNIQKPSVDDTPIDNEKPTDDDSSKEEDNSQVEKDANQMETGIEKDTNKESKSKKLNYTAITISILSFLALIILLTFYIIRRKKTASK